MCRIQEFAMQQQTLFRLLFHGINFDFAARPVGNPTEVLDHEHIW